jgi:hypothetical protein
LSGLSEHFYNSATSDAVPVTIADDGSASQSQRLPDATDGSAAADEPPTTDFWSLRRWIAKHGSPGLVATHFWGWISNGREY